MGSYASFRPVLPLRGCVVAHIGIIRSAVALSAGTHVSDGAAVDVRRMCTNFSYIQPAGVLVQGCEKIWLKKSDCWVDPRDRESNDAAEMICRNFHFDLTS